MLISPNYPITFCMPSLLPKMPAFTDIMELISGPPSGSLSNHYCSVTGVQAGAAPSPSNWLKTFSREKTYGILTLPVAKVREWLIARHLEKVYDKNGLLELYLNTVSFGENTYGIETASLTFFSKYPGDLLIEESAMLIGMLKASATYNPRLNPGAARDRRDIVLRQMHRYDYLDTEQLDSLLDIPVRLSYMKLDHISGPAPYFRENIRHEVMQILEDVKSSTGIEYNLYTDGLTIQTTLNFDLQRFAEISAEEHFSVLQQAFRKDWAEKEPWRKDPSLASLQIKQSLPYQSLEATGLDHPQILQAMKIKRPSRVFTWQGCPRYC